MRARLIAVVISSSSLANSFWCPSSLVPKKTLPSPTDTPRRVPLGPKPLAAVEGVHFHFTVPVLPLMAMTPPTGVSE